MAFTFKTLVDHPFTFAAGVGLANGFLAIARNKKIDPKTAVTLAGVLGLGELALVMYEPQEERGPIMSKMSLTEIGFYSVVGVVAGVLPFITWKPVPHGETAHPALVASTPGGGGTAVGGYGYARPRARRRAR